MMSEEDVEKLRVLQPVLVLEMNTEILVDPLQAAGSISEWHLSAIRYNSKEVRNEKLLDALKHKSVAQNKQFVEILRETNHDGSIMSYIGDYRGGFDVDEQSLTELERRNLEYIHARLIEEMNVEPLLDPLLAAGCLDENDAKRIKYKTHAGMNKELLDILKRRSTGQYKQFVQCLQDTNQQNVIEKLDSYRAIQVETVRKLKTECSIDSLAVLGGKLYVACGRKEMHVYDVTSFAQLDDIRLAKRDGEEHVSPEGLAACNVMNCLYMNDNNKKHIYRWIVEERDVTNWLDDIDTELRITNISVTSGGHVMLLDVFPSTLSIYDTEARILRRIILPEDMESPSHVLETPAGEYIICHGDDESEYCMSQVSHVTTEGHVIRSFGNYLGGGDHRLYIPQHLATDREGLIYVVDVHNYRVVVLDPMLNLRRVIHTTRDTWPDTRGFRTPRLLLYMEESKQMIVGMYYDIEVWKLT